MLNLDLRNKLKRNIPMSEDLGCTHYIVAKTQQRGNLRIQKLCLKKFNVYIY